ncbi:MAG: aminotransferase class I/II-fold pyridoxal phosphate-dependent enzyme [Firmicutes bacterium]|nr:aminotransferase class I/II-fold pyridoxal phosphate-dependent enzyme [Bacillota bacterium]
MIRWNNDYNHGAHPAILEALQNTNNISYDGYGLDDYCDAAKAEIQKYLGDGKADIHFMVGGTQVNFTVIAAALRPFESVISAASGHINDHETGAVENTGHKIHALPAVNGKITAEQITAEAQSFCDSGTKEHITQPKLVYLSFPTEFGTLYSKAELEAIRSVCDHYKLYLMVDGARMGYGLTAPTNDVTLEDLARLADVFYIGGTKCGALFGETVVIVNDDLKPHFRSYMKQNGGMLAKGWLLGLQFHTLFKDGLYFEITRKANKDAMKLKQAFVDKGIPFFIESSTNQQFPILTEAQMTKRTEKHSVSYIAKIDEVHHCVRFCTAWSTVPEDLQVLLDDIKAL